MKPISQFQRAKKHDLAFKDIRQVTLFEKGEHLNDNLDKQTNKTQNTTKTKTNCIIVCSNSFLIRTTTEIPLSALGKIEPFERYIYLDYFVITCVNMVPIIDSIF